LQSKFFPPNFSFVFWKREFWGEKFTLQKSAFTLQKKVFPNNNTNEEKKVV
jgi:hypothetical protein